MEKVRPRQRLEHRPCPQTPHGKRRTDQHPRLHRRYQIPRVQVDSRELRAAREWAQGDSRKGPVRRWRSSEITPDGLV